jgi:hypothetical protein
MSPPNPALAQNDTAEALPLSHQSLRERLPRRIVSVYWGIGHGQQRASQAQLSTHDLTALPIWHDHQVCRMGKASLKAFDAACTKCHGSTCRRVVMAVVNQGPAIQGSQQSRCKETMHVVPQKEIGIAIGSPQDLCQKLPECQP